MSARGIGLGMPSVLLLAQCARITSPLPAEAIRFTPPSVYRNWWSLTETCSGRVADLSAVSWYVVPGVASLPDTLDDVGGRWYGLGNRILLAGGEEWDGALVRHEMLHALLGAGGHPRTAFISDCRGVVVCVGPCITDGGPPPAPDPSAMAALPSALDIEAQVTPIPPIDPADGGYFMLIVTARNPRATPIAVHLPPSGDSGPPVSFSYRLTLAAPRQGILFDDFRADVPEDSSFAPGETKKYIFDFHVVSSSTSYFEIEPGTYRFAGGYGGIFADSQPTITISR